MKHRFSAATLAILIAVCSVFVPFAASAAVIAAPTPAAPAPSTGSSQALEISPPVVNLSGDPGETVKTQISIRDVANTPLIVTGQVNDFRAKDESGNPDIILDSTEDNPYSMKSWYGPLSKLTLQPKKIENLTVTINIPKNAAPGGYYSTIRFTATAPGIDSSGVSLSASLGALVLMRVKGDAKEQMTVGEFGTYDNFGRPAWLFESQPVDFVLRVKNEGNLHEQPVGQATVKDMFGNNIGLVNINLERNNVLPASTRKFTGTLDNAVLGDRFLFGRYTADLVVSYGANGQKAITTVAFWVLPWKLIIVIVVGLIGGFFLLRFGLRRYNDYILSRSPRRRR